MTDHDAFFRSELSVWPLARDNFRNLEKSLAGAVMLTDGGGWQFRKVLVNHRRTSITAKTDSRSIAARPCFLCAANRPPEQGAIRDGGYEILVNPYPLAPIHFTIASCRHEAQNIAGHIADLARLTADMSDMCVFYNGPRCGASAPDHLHFQAVTKETAANILDAALPLEKIAAIADGALFRSQPDRTPYPFFIIDAPTAETTEKILSRLLAALPPADPEPMVNIAMVTLPDGGLRTFVAPRRRHRPAVYGTEPSQLLVSPATIEMLGTLVCSRPEDFDCLDLTSAASILAEVGLSEEELTETVTNFLTNV